MNVDSRHRRKPSRPALALAVVFFAAAGIAHAKLGGGTLIAKQLGKSTFTTDTGARMADGTLGFNPFANPYEGATPGQADGEHGNASGNGNGNGGGNGNGNPGGNGNGGGNPDPNAVATTAVVSPETYSVEYVHTDALGSPVAYTNSSGNGLPDRRTQYEPYGAPTTTPRDGEPSYTGHQYDTSTGLIYAQHRYYDPALGRFLGVDPMAVDTTSAFNWNRYAYANNSPYKFTDPDGRESACFATGVGCGLTPITDEIREKQFVAMVGLTATVLTAGVAAEYSAAILPAAVVAKKVGSGIARQTTKQLEKSRETLKGRVDEHVKKLDDYKRNPDKFDNEGTLANAPSAAVREKIIPGRVKALEGQIKKNEGELKKVEEQLKKAAE